MLPEDDPRREEKVEAMAFAILDAWPDDHVSPLPEPDKSAPLRSIGSALEDLSKEMAEFLLYNWENGRKKV
jgi:hypothetical protein